MDCAIDTITNVPWQKRSNKIIIMMTTKNALPYVPCSKLQSCPISITAMEQKMILLNKFTFFVEIWLLQIQRAGLIDCYRNVT